MYCVFGTGVDSLIPLNPIVVLVLSSLSSKLFVINSVVFIINGLSTFSDTTTAPVTVVVLPTFIVPPFFVVRTQIFGALFI